jgi:AraC family ethanolamine operon transcriptional activator
MLLNKGGAASAQGVALEENHVLIFEPRQEFELSVLGRSTILVVAIEEELFRDYARARWDNSFALRNSNDHLVLRQAPNQRAIRQECKKLLTLIRCKRFLVSNSLFAPTQEMEIVEQLLRTVKEPKPCPVGPSRRQAAKRAAEYLVANMANAVSMADVCKAAKVTERTLLLGFHEVFGVPPKSFHKSLRLNRVNLDLRRALPGTTVTEAAVRWGFTHLSRFAADYRQMFGELPNETLRKTLKNQPK